MDNIEELLNKVLESLKKIEDSTLEASIIKDAKFLTIERASTYTGMTERTIRDLISQGELSVCRPSPNRAFVPKQSLDMYMSRNAIMSNEELDAIVNKKVRNQKR